MIINEEYKLAYLPCPKNACTSLKKYFYYLYYKKLCDSKDLANIHDIFKTRFIENVTPPPFHHSLTSTEILEELNSRILHIFYIKRSRRKIHFRI